MLNAAAAACGLMAIREPACCPGYGISEQDVGVKFPARAEILSSLQDTVLFVSYLKQHRNL
jgi:hypothetical protein